jgi:hypothetical protein
MSNLARLHTLHLLLLPAKFSLLDGQLLDGGNVELNKGHYATKSKFRASLKVNLGRRVQVEEKHKVQTANR